MSSYIGAPGHEFRRVDSNKDTQTAVSEAKPAPSFQTREMKSTSEDSTQRTVQHYSTAPTQSVLHAVEPSVAKEGTRLGSKTSGDQAAPSRNGLGHRDNSKTKHSQGATNTRTPAAPGLTLLPPINESHLAEESTETLKVNQPEDVGITLAGEKFRNVNPTAYYMAKKNLV